MPATVQCPNCGRPVPWVADEKFRPFCSERCKLIDLGEWASGRYALPGESAGDQGTGAEGQDRAGDFDD